MAVNKTTLDRAEQLLKATEISMDELSKSTILSKEEKSGYLAMNLFIYESLKKGIESKKIKSRDLNYLEIELLNPWNNSFNPEIDSFWAIIERESIKLKRVDVIEKIVSRGWFKPVEQAIDIFNNAYPLKQSDNYSVEKKELISKLNDLVDYDRQKRVKLLRTCLKRGTIAFSNIPKYGEAQAYLVRTNQYDEFFSKEEQEVLLKLRDGVSETIDKAIIRTQDRSNAQGDKP